MAELKHGAHECVLTSPEIPTDGICNICFKDELVESACDLCNFDLCKPCSKLPLLVSHGFHKEHPLEFCVDMKEGSTRHKLCSGCGVLFSWSFYYKCKECDIFLDLGCAILNNIEASWETKEIFHYSHAHLLRRCKPGQDSIGSSCLMCELPLTPSTISYGCFQCYSFVHERCLNLPREIKHPVHPEHPLIRLDFTHTCGRGKACGACGLHIDGVPLGCPKCNFNLHLRCADSLLRGLMHKSHHHRLFYVAENANNSYMYERCPVCRREFSKHFPYYHCLECRWWIHLECLEIPEYVVKNSYHIHPLLCEKFSPEDDSLEYCGVCETKIHAGHHAYCCKECDYLGHLGCILQEELPSPLYLKELYFCRGENGTRQVDSEECATKEIEIKLMVNDVSHNHVLTCGEGQGFWTCRICHGFIDDKQWKCESCDFKAHDSCVKLRKQSRYRFHLHHPLTFLPSYPAGTSMSCDTCKEAIYSFNLFCRVCNFVICTKCTVRAKKGGKSL